MIWIMILVVNGAHLSEPVAVTSVEFSSKETCDAAGKLAQMSLPKLKLDRPRDYPSIRYVCVVK